MRLPVSCTAAGTSIGWITVALLSAARAAVLRSAIFWPAAAWAVTARGAVIRTGVLRPAVILQPAVARARILWPSIGGRDQGQRPEQEADEDLGAQ
jgi:hypothetical protein